MARSSHVAASASLPFASTAVGELQKIIQFVNKASEEPEIFLANLGPLLSEVAEHLELLQRAGGPNGSDAEKKVFKLLWPGVPKPPPRPPFKRDDFPSLVRLLDGFQQTAKTNLRRLAKSTHERAPTERTKFQSSFKAFANVRSDRRGPPLSDLIASSSRPVWYEEYAACLRLLHATLCRCSHQVEGCRGTFVANVALTRVQKVEKTKDDVPFDFFFLHRHPNSVGDMWKEVRISVFLQGEGSKKSRVRWLSAQKISPEEFCGLVRRRERGRLVLNAANDGLVYERVELNFEQLQRLFLLKSSSVSLATVLEKRKLHGNPQLKLLLSYLLAKAVWQFYDSDWMTPNWSKHTIHFMRERLNGALEAGDILTLIHKPYFATELGPSPTTSSCPLNDKLPDEHDLTHRFPSATHSHPRILALGIMLLEIELGEGIELHRLDEDFCEDDDPIENDDHYTAGKIILSPMWARRNVYQAVKEMIEICLRPDTAKFGTDEGLARDNLHTYVVAPLSRLFKQAWSHDRDPESFSPDPVSFKSTEIPAETYEPLQSSSREINPHSPLPGPASIPLTPMVHIESGLNTSRIAVREKPQPVAGISGLMAGELLADKYDEHTIESRRARTDDWFAKFQALLVNYRLLGRGRDKRIKVAILDSGINVHHPDFSDEDRDRIKEKVSFIGDNAETDISGHGTHVAAIILRLTKNVDIYVGKITNSSSVDQFEDVEKALIYSRTQWRVDMINISFGFDGVQNPDTMGSEIRQCLHEGIMVFASASNDGGEGSRTYPAKYSNVVCAHSATYNGSKSEYNPGLEEGRNFSFVGEHVRPIWSAETRTGDSRMKYASGTSYATPVAVSVAAFMIGYIRKKMPDYIWTIKPWSPQGILIIFELMATEMDRYDWVSPTRYMKYTKEEKIMGDLKQYLG
ncbi:hypothetical protein G7054_g3488 [Neopestalotiopsis clavispora]|nr:hypothetical protein G7054_g3488 [Neopestalotiopsis clavispora]